MKQGILADRGRLLTQIAGGNLDVAIIGQLTTPELSLDDYLEPGPLEVECLHAALWRRRLIEKALEEIRAVPS